MPPDYDQQQQQLDAGQAPPDAGSGAPAPGAHVEGGAAPGGEDIGQAHAEAGVGWLESLSEWAESGLTSKGEVDPDSNAAGGVTGAKVGSAAAGFMGGIMDFGKGMNEMGEGHAGEGLLDMGKGGLDVVGGFANLFSVPGSLWTEGAEKVSGVTGAVTGAINSGEDIYHGVKDYEAAKDADSGSAGLGGILKGGIEGIGAIAQGVGTFAEGSALPLLGDITVDAATATAGAAAGTVASLAAAAAAGVTAGIGMESASKSSGLITQDGVVGPDGKPINESGADKTADWAQKAAEWVDPTVYTDDGCGIKHQGGSSALADIVGIDTELAMTPMTLGLDVATTAQSGWNWLKKEL